MILRRALSAARLDEALEDLNRRIKDGQEYPDASWAVSQSFLVPYEALQAAYDAQEARPS